MIPNDELNLHNLGKNIPQSVCDRRFDVSHMWRRRLTRSQSMDEQANKIIFLSVDGNRWSSAAMFESLTTITWHSSAIYPQSMLQAVAFDAVSLLECSMFQPLIDSLHSSRPLHIFGLLFALSSMGSKYLNGQVKKPSVSFRWVLAPETESFSPWLPCAR